MNKIIWRDKNILLASKVELMYSSTFLYARPVRRWGVVGGG